MSEAKLKHANAKIAEGADSVCSPTHITLKDRQRKYH